MVIISVHSVNLCTQQVQNFSAEQVIEITKHLLTDSINSNNNNKNNPYPQDKASQEGGTEDLIDICKTMC